MNGNMHPVQHRLNDVIKRLHAHFTICLKHRELLWP